MSSKLVIWAVALCAALCGCASGGAKQAPDAADRTPVEALAVGAAAAYYHFAHAPAWSAQATAEADDVVSLELSKSRLTQGGDGAASMVFSDAAKSWCKSRGASRAATLEFVEYWEPTMVGATRKARGRARCET